MTPRELSQRLNLVAEALCRELLPEGKRQGTEWCVGDLHGTAGDSCRVHLSGDKAGVWSDFQTGQSGGDLLDLWCATRSVDLGRAMREAKAWLGISDTEFEPKTRKAYQRPSRPKDVKRPTAVADYLNKRGITDATIAAFQIGERTDKHGKPVIVFPYKRDGELVALKYLAVERGEDGKKIIWSEKDCEPCLFGWQAMDPTVRAVALTEGECFPPDAQVMTTSGWVRFADYREGKVLQYSPDGSGQFVYPLAKIEKPFSGRLVRHENERWVSLTTPGHKLISIDRRQRLRAFRSEDAAPAKDDTIPHVCEVDGPGIPLSDDQIRLCLAVSADATIDVRKGAYAGGNARNIPRELRYARFGFKRQRKIDRMRLLLDNLGIERSDNRIAHGYTSICFSLPQWVTGRLLDWTWIVQASCHQRELILSELVLWDGNAVVNRNQSEYSTKLLENAEWVQTLAHLSGRCSTIMPRKNQYGRWYKVSILHGKRTSSWQTVHTSEVPYEGLVYCLTVPSGMLLVRQEGRIAVSGNCDAMTLHQMGIAALSVPGGAGNHQWIESDYDHLERFEQIFLCFDSDTAGRKGAMAIIDRLGRHRCRIVEIPHKDANAALMSGAGLKEFAAWFAQARTMDPDELKNAGHFTEEVIAEFYPNGEIAGLGLPWDKVADKVRFRPGELSIWTGLNGSGKSLALGFIAIHAMSNAQRVCIASMEMLPRKTLYRMVRQASGMRLPSEGYIRAIQNWFGEGLWLFDVTGTAKTIKLMADMEYAVRRYAISEFIVDSLAKCGIAEDDYAGQKALVEQLSDFARRHGTHVHLVVHPRKQEDEDAPPGKMDVKGTGAITDMADNVFSVWRNKRKEKAIQDAYAEHAEPDQETLGKPDVTITCSKQRNGEWEGGIALWFDRESWQYLGAPREPRRRYVKFFGESE